MPKTHTKKHILEYRKLYIPYTTKIGIQLINKPITYLFEGADKYIMPVFHRWRGR